MKIKILLSAAVVAALATSCKDKNAFEQTETGLKYKHHNEHKEGAVNAKEGDVVTLELVYKTAKDSVIFDSKKNGQPVQLPLGKASFKGDIVEGIAMMGAGDSSTFMINADSFFLKTVRAQQVPPFIKKGEMLTFNVKVTKVQSQQEMQEEQQKKAMEAKAMEQTKLQEYLTANNITQTPTASGLYYIELEKGKGKKAEAGKKVSVNYTGMLIDGKVFDTSVEESAKKAGSYNPQRPYKPLEFQLGAGQMIMGFDEGVALMNIGGKARLIMPSQLGYGDQGQRGIIPPSATLIFEVELVEMK